MVIREPAAMLRTTVVSTHGHVDLLLSSLSSSFSTFMSRTVLDWISMVIWLLRASTSSVQLVSAFWQAGSSGLCACATIGLNNNNEVMSILLNMDFKVLFH